MRRTTDTNRIVDQIRQACFACVAVLMLLAVVIDPCFGQAADTGLPKGFRPPPPTPKELSIEKPLTNEDEVVEARKKKPELQAALDSGKVNPDTQKLIDMVIRVNVQELSMTERRDELTTLRKSITRYFDQFIDATKHAEMKKFACDSIVKHATTLLDGNFHVRLQAVLLIGELNMSPEMPGLRPKPAVAFIDGLPVLLDVIQPPQGGLQQPEPVRILAAMGAHRLLELGRHTLKINSKIPVDSAKRMLAQLEGNGTDWYHLRLIEALVQTALATVPNAQNQQEPAIVEALARILSNPQRSYRIRARAAKLLGRTPMPPGVQAAPIAYSIVKLTQQIATDLNQRRIFSDHALFELNDVYLAFKAEKGESTTDGRKQAGLVSTLNQQPIQSAYKDILPIIKSIFRQFQGAPAGKPVQATIEPALIQKLNDWVKPGDMTLVPGGVSIEKTLRKAAPATTSAVPPQARRQRNSVISTS